MKEVEVLLKLGGPGMLEALQVVQRVRADVDKERCGETGVRLTLPTASLRTTLDPSGEFGKQLKKPKSASQGAAAAAAKREGGASGSPAKVPP
tara:strand:+ start:532 stop:810 length:279 start_codon:yes stop_codon:yes gene_type:complete